MAANPPCLRRMSVDEFSAPPVARSIGGDDQDTVFTFPHVASPTAVYETGRLCVHTQRAVELYSPRGDVPSSPSQPQRRRRMPSWKRRERRRLERQAVAFERGFLSSAPPVPQASGPGRGRRASLVIEEPPTSPAEEKKEKSQGDSPTARSAKKANKTKHQKKKKSRKQGKSGKSGKKVAVRRRRSVRQHPVEKAVRRVAESLDRKEERAQHTKQHNTGFWWVEPESPIDKALDDVDWASLDMWLPDLSAEEEA